MGEILLEVSQLCSNGVKEITLLGQNVNAYGKDLGNDNRFIELLEALSRTRRAWIGLDLQLPIHGTSMPHLHWQWVRSTRYANTFICLSRVDLTEF